MWNAERVRRSVREKLQRAIQDVAQPLTDDQMRALNELRGELADTREQIGREVSLLGDRLSEELRIAAAATDGRLEAFEIRSRRDILCAGEAAAAGESAVFARQHLAAARPFGHPHRTLQYALSLAPTGGMALEFGVYTGSTLKIIAAARGGRHVYGFDSFDGLPEHWRPGFAAGTFATDTRPEIAGAQVIPGAFEQTLPGFLHTHPGPVDFLHIDSDLYSSANTVLRLTGPRLHTGTIIVFDEFFNYPGWQDHEHRAWTEYVDHTHITFRYEAFTADNEQLAVSVTSIP